MKKETWQTTSKGGEAKDVTAKFYTEDEIAALEAAGMKSGDGDRLNKAIRFDATAAVRGGEKALLAAKKKELNQAIASGKVNIDELLASVKA